VAEPDTARSDSQLPSPLIQQAKPVLTARDRSRASEFVTGQLTGIGVAIGAVWAGRNVLPNQMKQLNALVAKQLFPNAEKIERHMVNMARRRINVGLMFAGGLACSLLTQTALSRKRRATNGEALDDYTPLPVHNDIGRLLTGWSAGLVGASATYWLAERYGRASSPHVIKGVLNQAEGLLDKTITGGVEIYPGNKLSELLVSNLVMLPGAMPFSITGQRLYDALIQPDYAHER